MQTEMQIQRAFMNTLVALRMIEEGQANCVDGIVTLADGRVAVIDDWLPPTAAYAENTPEGQMSIRRMQERQRLNEI